MPQNLNSQLHQAEQAPRAHMNHQDIQDLQADKEANLSRDERNLLTKQMAEYLIGQDNDQIDEFGLIETAFRCSDMYSKAVVLSGTHGNNAPFNHEQVDPYAAATVIALKRAIKSNSTPNPTNLETILAMLLRIRRVTLLKPWSERSPIDIEL